MQQPDPAPDAQPVLIVSDGENGEALEEVKTPTKSTSPAESPSSSEPQTVPKEVPDEEHPSADHL